MYMRIGEAEIDASEKGYVKVMESRFSGYSRGNKKEEKRKEKE